MIFKVGNPDYPQYDFFTISALPEVERLIEAFGPMKYLVGTYDWPKWFAGFRGWTDTINSLWWPKGADNFATLVILLDSTREMYIRQSVLLQRATIPYDATAWPYVILSAYLSVGEKMPCIGIEDPVEEPTLICEWKLYPLSPIDLTEQSKTEKLAGMWLLPLVDVRYFTRTKPLNTYDESSSSGDENLSPLPIVWTDPQNGNPQWMPPLLGYPQDTGEPDGYTPIVNTQLHPNINASMRWGEAVDLQASLHNWRVVNRDVRSDYNTLSGGLPHSEFGGVLCDYPEKPGSSSGYHTDAIVMHAASGGNYCGGEADRQILASLTSRKLQIQFRCRGDDAYYALLVRPVTGVEYPQEISQLEISSPSNLGNDKPFLTQVTIGVPASGRYPTVGEIITLEDAALQWSRVYYLWRAKQVYFKYPAVVPVIPNGYAHAIRWDFSTTRFETTYVALEGVQGTEEAFQTCIEPFYAIIKGEGSIDDDLQGYYAWEELQDVDGELIPIPNSSDDYPRFGYVLHVNGALATFNAARDESGKVAVPVGLVVLMVPGRPYLDVALSVIQVPYRFTTTDLVQIVTINNPIEVNELGNKVAGTIQTWDTNLQRFVDSDKVWLVLLD